MIEIPVSRALNAVPWECKQVSIPLDLHLNSYLSARYKPGNAGLSLSVSTFVTLPRCYILLPYLRNPGTALHF